MSNSLIGRSCRVRNVDARDPCTGARLYNRTGAIAEQYENEARVVLLVRLEGITELVCLLLTDVDILPDGNPCLLAGKFHTDAGR